LEGETIKEFDQIKQQTSSHFLKLYTSNRRSKEAPSESLLGHIPSKISNENNLKLNRQIEETKILKAINQFNKDKAPKPNGFTLHFYKKCWHIIKQDFIRMIRYVHKSKKWEEPPTPF
jgi:hypothetical protein